MKHQQVSVDYWAMIKSMFLYGVLTVLGWIMLRLFNAVFSLPRRLRTQQENIQATLEEFQRRYPDLNVTEDDIKNAEKELEEWNKEMDEKLNKKDDDKLIKEDDEKLNNKDDDKLIKEDDETPIKEDDEKLNKEDDEKPNKKDKEESNNENETVTKERSETPLAIEDKKTI